MSVSGNGPSEIKKVIEQMRSIAKGRFMRQAVAVLGHESVARVKDCFRSGEDPYGYKWAPVQRGGEPLLDTGRLRNANLSNSRMIGNEGYVEIFNPTKYAAIQNFGGRVKSRAILNRTLSFNKKGRFAGRRQNVWNSVKVKPYNTTAFTIKARPFVPDERGLPPAWEEKFITVLGLLFQKVVGGPTVDAK